MGFAQIKLPLDSAARLILELSIPKQLVDVLPLGGNQEDLYVIVKLDQLAMVVVAVAAMLDMS